ncbi:MAG: c-type cytochrome, partial [Chloroflexi bacterium]|nr:c-type cytochrome [Chloroflexota bacterium]
LATFRLEPGLRVELAAAEPTVVAPVALAFDEMGRLYVAENRGYPTGPGASRPPAGMIALLEDADGDGRFEKRTVFADGLTFPNGVMPWKGGVFVTCAPDVLYLKDTNGDGRADVRRVVLTGFATTGSTQLRVSHPTLGLDGWVYLASGLVGGQITAPDFPNHPAVDIARTDLRFRPDTSEFEAADGKAQFGLTFDDLGHRFNCMNRVHIRQIVLPSRYLRRNPHLAFSETMQNLPESMVPEPLKGHGSAARIYPISRNITTADSHAGTFTAACGVLVYRGTALPEEYWGNALACDPAGNLVHRDRLDAAGATFVARRAREDVEFLASSDDWFRPVFLANAPDGALYLCDMYRKTIEHPEYLPVEIRKHTDFDSGKDKGRIYRVTGDHTKTKRPKVALGGASVKTLCAELGNPNAWWRETAQRLLIERQDPAAVPLLKTAILDSPPLPPPPPGEGSYQKSAVTTLHALRTLDALGALDDASIRRALAHPHPAVREHGLQLAEARLAHSAALASRVLALAEDADARVRFQCALTLGELDDSRTTPALAKIAVRDAADRWARAAVLSSAGRRAEAFFKEVVSLAAKAAHDTADIQERVEEVQTASSSSSSSSSSKMDARSRTRTRTTTRTIPKIGFRDASPDDGLTVLMGELGRMLGTGQPRDRLGTLLQEVTASNRREDAAWQMAALNGFAEGLRSRGLGGKDRSPLLSLLHSAAGAGPAEQRVRELMTQSKAMAVDNETPVAARLAAVSFLAQAEFDLAGGALMALLDPHQPVALQSAAVRSLAQMPAAGIVPALLGRERWGSYTPPVRESVIAALLSQSRHVPGLLAAMEAGDIPPSALDSARRNQLLQHKEEAIRQRAQALFKNLQAGDRMKVYEEYKSVLALPADARNGRAVFKQHCATCHRLDREGVPVGPDLFGIRNQPTEAILLHILIPEYEIVPGFAGYVIETKDGRTLSALIASETANSLTLRQALGEEETLLRTNIASISATALSLMPQELEKNMSRQEMADLIAYLKGEGAGD